MSETEIYGITGKDSLSSLHKGEKITLKIENKISKTWAGPSEIIELNVHGNMTIYEIKQKLAEQIGRMNWQQIKLMCTESYKKITNNHNGLNLRDLNFKNIEELELNNLPKVVSTKEDLLLKDNVWNPKAEQCFLEIFNRFNIADGWGLPQAAEFTAIVLSDTSIGPTDNRVINLFEKYDSDNDKVLKFEDFLRFYYDSTVCREHVVFENLLMLGYGKDLKKITSNTITLEEEDLVRNVIPKRQNLYNFIFSLLSRNDNLGQQALDLVLKLPVNEENFNSLTDFKSQEKNEDNTGYNWDKIIQSNSIHQIKYFMIIINYLMEEPSQNNWRIEFIKYGGFNYFINLLFKANKGEFNDDDSLVIYSFVLKMLKKYIEISISKSNRDVYKNLAFIYHSWIDYDTFLKVYTTDIDANEDSNNKEIIEHKKSNIHGPYNINDNKDVSKNKNSNRNIDLGAEQLKESQEFLDLKLSISDEICQS